MSMEVPTSDTGLLCLLRIAGRLSLVEMADAMEVTATAVRYRLIRLLAQDAIQREAVRQSRGRPKYSYVLTAKGIRRTNSEWMDGALVRWRQICEASGEEIRRETLRRIARGLAAGRLEEIWGEAPAKRVESLPSLLSEPQSPLSDESVGASG
jgi:DeoR family transcriptional regulator, suf operon transcriptional repressor